MNRKKQQTECVRIDCDKFRNAIENHGYTARDLGLKIGYSQGYFWGFTSGARDLLPVRVVTLLDLVGIHLDEYEHTEPIIPEEPQDDLLPWDVPQDKTITVRLDEDQLAQIGVMIREQVYEAMKTIWGTN